MAALAEKLPSGYRDDKAAGDPQHGYSIELEDQRAQEKRADEKSSWECTKRGHDGF